MYIKLNSVYVEPGTVMDNWAAVNERWMVVNRRPRRTLLFCRRELVLPLSEVGKLD